MITTSTADDIVYTNLFTGVHGNYLKGSIEAQGLDPENLEESDSSKMNFSSGASKPKSWKEIWGSGQGISVVKSILPASELIKRINNEYLEAKKNLL
jgi:nitronate monooxygenase